MRKLKIEKNWKFDSYIGWNMSWWNYYNQYRNATLDLVKAVDKGVPIDTVSLPILFLIRHSLELGLKANILEFEKFSNAKPKLKLDGKSHQLIHLYDYFITHLKSLTINYKLSPNIVSKIVDFDNSLSKLTSKLNLLDQGSYNFRYPIDKQGGNNFEREAKLNVLEYVDLMGELDSFLLVTTSVLAEHGMFDEDEIMRNEM